MCQIFIPIFYKPKPNKLKSIQLGWHPDNRIPKYQRLLNVSDGGDQHLLETENTMQTVQIEELYQAINDRYGLNLIPHALTYHAEEKRFRCAYEASEWVMGHPKKTYLIGNEPDGTYITGGNNLTMSEYADFYYQASKLIRVSDPKAYLVMGAWAGGVGEKNKPAHNENDMLLLYYRRYGKMDVQALSWHCYQKNSVTNPYPVNKLNRFADYAKEWKDNGWIDTTDIMLTEFGWYGLDEENNTPENCIAFMDNFIPKLRAHKQVRGFWWWEWGDGAMLLNGESLSNVGEHYKNI